MEGGACGVGSEHDTDGGEFGAGAGVDEDERGREGGCSGGSSRVRDRGFELVLGEEVCHASVYVCSRWFVFGF